MMPGIGGPPGPLGEIPRIDMNNGGGRLDRRRAATGRDHTAKMSLVVAQSR